MDKRLQNIIENLEAMKIGPDDSFKFQCRQCGNCCINREDIILAPRDIYNLSKELGISPEKLCSQYCKVYVGQDSRVPIVRLAPRGSGQIRRCPLLRNKKCRVHKAKPSICAMYPIGRCLMAGKDHVSGKEFQTKDIIFIFTGADCSDGSEKHTVREWLESFGIPVEDDFFIKWQNIVLELSSIFRKMERKISMDTMQKVWLAAYMELYLHYDVKKEFLLQFEENARHFLEMLHTAFS